MAQTTQRFEYHVADGGMFDSKEALESRLNDYARQGWQLKEIQSILTAKWFILERPV
jgi:hypothetical protein